MIFFPEEDLSFNQVGAWVVRRHLAGDDTGMGGDDRASLHLTSEPTLLHISLYTYR